jgi:hypothetical protein
VLAVSGPGGASDFAEDDDAMEVSGFKSPLVGGAKVVRLRSRVRGLGRRAGAGGGPAWGGAQWLSDLRLALEQAERRKGTNNWALYLPLAKDPGMPSDTRGAGCAGECTLAWLRSACRSRRGRLSGSAASPKATKAGPVEPNPITPPFHRLHLYKLVSL